MRGGGPPRTVAKPLVQGLAAHGSPSGDPSMTLAGLLGRGARLGGDPSMTLAGLLEGRPPGRPWVARLATS